MTPEQKVVSLETARKLKEAGFPQDTERWWQDDYHLWLASDFVTVGGKMILPKNATPAPDAQEIGELLPEQTALGFLRQEKNTGDDGEYWSVMYYTFEEPLFETEPVEDNPRVQKLKPAKEKISVVFEAENEAEARAACWLWLKEQKLI